VKSFFLEGLFDEQSARCELSRVLPSQEDPWLLLSEPGDPIAYFNIVTDEAGVPCIQADVSGRHADQHSRVVSVLHELQRRLGGTLCDDN
jgi:hypothetical protein